MNRIKRYSGALALLSALLAWGLHLQEPRCSGAAGTLPRGQGKAAVDGAATSRPSGAALPARNFSSFSSPLPAPSTVPAVLECQLPPDVLAPTTRASPSAQPSMRAAPVGAVDALAAASRAASLARQTAQCGYVVSGQLGNASARLLPCDDYPRAVEGGFREGRDGPFFTPQCPSVWFTPSEACDLLQGLNKLILFVGDSIARQVQQGLFTALTGSYTHGGVPKFSFPEAEVCRCDDAYKFDCRQKTFANYMGPGHLVCPKWVERGYVGTLMNLHEANYFNEHIGEVHGVMTVGAESYSGSVIVLNLGLHDNLDAAYLMKEVYGPVIEEAKARGTVRVICMALPAPDEDLKPAEFRENQGRRAVLEFNEKMRRFCRDRSAETMELYAPSENASSYDGTCVRGCAPPRPRATKKALTTNYPVHTTRLSFPKQALCVKDKRALWAALFEPAGARGRLGRGGGNPWGRRVSLAQTRTCRRGFPRGTFRVATLGDGVLV
jgi:hypothetical protein